MDREEMTEYLLSSCGLYPRHAFTEKRAGAKLTPTEQIVMDRIDAADGGLRLSFVSGSLKYDGAVRWWPKRERQALYSLLHRGTLRMYRQDNITVARELRGTYPHHYEGEYEYRITRG